MNVVESIRETIACHNLIPEGKPVVVGVSGGADSVALLHAFQMLEIPCTVAHMNHQLRVAESDADEQFVRQLAQTLDLPMEGTSVDVQALAQTTGQSVEMAARQARHTFFATFDDAVIALGHHADDQAETFLLKLARGAGTQGLSGMPFFQTLENLHLIRPLLHVSRSEIIQWLENNRLEWREDSSNAQEHYLRNKVRHSILPMLENELNPNIRATLLRTMDILREENEWMEEMLEGFTLEDELPLAAKRRLLRNWLFDQGAETAGFDAVEQILRLMDQRMGSTIFELNERQRVVVEYGKPRFETDDFQTLEVSWTLSTEPGTGWVEDRSRIGAPRAIASLSAEKVGDSTLTVRAWQPGDRIAPLGMEGSRKLQDILTDFKVPKAERNDVPVIECNGKIVWVPGFRIARGWELKNPAEKAIHLKLERNRTE